MNDARPRVVVVVLNYNGWKDAAECLKSLSKVDYPIEIIVIDNGSTDDSAESLRNFIEELPNSTLVCSSKNGGISGGNNLGIWCALSGESDYIVLLSNDTTVEPDFVSHLVRAAEDDVRVGLVGAKVCYHGEPERIWFAGARFSPWLARAPFICANQLDDPDVHRGVWPADVLMGCVMLIRREVVETVGAFDTDYFFQNEDLDFCYRVRDANWKVVVAMDARIYHKIGRTVSTASPARWYYGARNRLLFIRRRLPLIYKLSAYVCFFGSFAAHFVRWWLIGRRDLVGASIAGMFDFYAGRFGPWVRAG